MENIMKIAALFMISFAVSASALDTTEIDKRIKDLSSDDAKVRIAAIKDLYPLYQSLETGLRNASHDKNPEVVAALMNVDSATPQFIAANETEAAKNCVAYAQAQEIYHRTDWDADGVLEYAQAFKGNNSLLDKKAGDNLVGLIDRTLADAEGAPGKATPRAGYYFKILTKQGAAAKGGAKDYINNGNMTLGYALIAFPAEYGKSGRKSFMINHTGFIYEKNLGAETHTVVEKMTEFDPDKSWVPTE
jgi:hypothetical protein